MSRGVALASAFFSLLIVLGITIYIKFRKDGKLKEVGVTITSPKPSSADTTKSGNGSPRPGSADSDLNPPVEPEATAPPKPDAAMTPLVDSSSQPEPAQPKPEPAASQPETTQPATIVDDRIPPGQMRFNNSLRMPFCWCPAGTFQMGSPLTEPEHKTDEGPIKVTLSRGFWMGKFEVTQAQWQTVMGTTVQEQETKATWHGMAGVGPDLPMYHVNHVEAEEFCRKLTVNERRLGRLSEGGNIDCPPRPNGNMPAAPVRRQPRRSEIN